jgi:hypothetical protein
MDGSFYATDNKRIRVCLQILNAHIQDLKIHSKSVGSSSLLKQQCLLILGQKQKICYDFISRWEIQSMVNSN